MHPRTNLRPGRAECCAGISSISDVPEEYEIQLVNPPITYGIPAMRVRLIADAIRVGRETVNDYELLEGKLTFADAEFRVDIDESPRAEFLIPVLSDDPTNDNWALVVEDNPLPRCQPKLLNRFLPSACTGSAVSKIVGLLAACLRPLFVEFLSHVPAPQWFDVRGDAENLAYLTAQSGYQIGQVIRAYAQVVSNQ
jgi:hypothetical protein